MTINESNDEERADQDRRLIPRVAARLGVKMDLGEGGTLRARSCDLGTGGLCIESEQPFGLDGLRSVEITLPQERLRLAVSGRWQREDPAAGVFLSGASFENTPQEVTYRIWQYVQKRAGEIAELLNSYSALELDLDEAVELALYSRTLDVPAGHVIYGEGGRSESDGAYVLLSGKVRLRPEGMRGSEGIDEEVEEGELFGGLPLVGVASDEVAYADPSASLLHVDRHAFRHLQDSKPRAALAVERRIAGRLTQRATALIHALSKARMATGTPVA